MKKVGETRMKITARAYDNFCCAPLEKTRALRTSVETVLHISSADRFDEGEPPSIATRRQGRTRCRAPRHRTSSCHPSFPSYKLRRLRQKQKHPRKDDPPTTHVRPSGAASRPRAPAPVALLSPRDATCFLCASRRTSATLLYIFIPCINLRSLNVPRYSRHSRHCPAF